MARNLAATAHAGVALDVDVGHEAAGAGAAFHVVGAVRKLVLDARDVVLAVEAVGNAGGVGRESGLQVARVPMPVGDEMRAVAPDGVAGFLREKRECVDELGAAEGEVAAARAVVVAIVETAFLVNDVPIPNEFDLLARALWRNVPEEIPKRLANQKFMRAGAVLMVKARMSSCGLTSRHESGMETGAPRNGLALNGATSRRPCPFWT